MKKVKEQLKEVLNEPYNPDLPLEVVGQMLNVITMTIVIITATGAFFLISKGIKFFKKTKGAD